MTLTTYFISPITARPASGPGALDGFQATCSCGLVIRGSFQSYVRGEVIRHAEWHEAKGHVFKPSAVKRSFVLSAYPDWMVREWQDGHVDAAQLSGPGLSPGCASIQEAIAWVKTQS